MHGKPVLAPTCLLTIPCKLMDYYMGMICWQEQHDGFVLKRGTGGRVKKLEGVEVIVDEFAPVGVK